jgi:hypothetical protein
MGGSGLCAQPGAPWIHLSGNVPAIRDLTENVCSAAAGRRRPRHAADQLDDEFRALDADGPFEVGGTGSGDAEHVEMRKLHDHRAACEPNRTRKDEDPSTWAAGLRAMQSASTRDQEVQARTDSVPPRAPPRSPPSVGACPGRTTAASGRWPGCARPPPSRNVSPTLTDVLPLAELPTVQAPSEPKLPDEHRAMFYRRAQKRVRGERSAERPAAQRAGENPVILTEEACDRERARQPRAQRPGRIVPEIVPVSSQNRLVGRLERTSEVVDGALTARPGARQGRWQHYDWHQLHFGCLVAFTVRAYHLGISRDANNGGATDGAMQCDTRRTSIRATSARSPAVSFVSIASWGL